jgi:hypothetical protein
MNRARCLAVVATLVTAALQSSPASAGPPKVIVANRATNPVITQAHPALAQGVGDLHQSEDRITIPGGTVLTDVLVRYGSNGVDPCGDVRIIGGGGAVFAYLNTSGTPNGWRYLELHLQSGLPSVAGTPLQFALENPIEGGGACQAMVSWTGYLDN